MSDLPDWPNNTMLECTLMRRPSLSEKFEFYGGSILKRVRVLSDARILLIIGLSY